MKRVSVKLSELKPNPYKKFIQGGEVDEVVIAQIMESVERTSLWEQWVVRESDSGFQLAFGHNRLAAAKKILGADAKVSVQVEDYDDAQMYIAMADENAGEEESTARQVDTVRKAQQLLKTNPSWCKAASHGETEARSKYASHDHEHGSINCILAFLGENNWSRAKIGKLLKLAEDASASVIEATATPHETRNDSTQGRIGQVAALALSNLPRSTQEAAVETIRSLDVGIPVQAVRDAVEEVSQLPPSRQDAGIKRVLKRKAETQRIAELQRKRKLEARGMPKTEKKIPDVRSLMATWAVQIRVITQEIAALKPHKQMINKDANFVHLDKRVAELAKLIDELRGEKPKPEPIRTAQQDFKQLN